MNDFDGSFTVVLAQRFFDGAKSVIGMRNGIIAGAVAWALLLTVLVIVT
jgi:hypothetical protein